MHPRHSHNQSSPHLRPPIFTDTFASTSLSPKKPTLVHNRTMTATLNFRIATENDVIPLEHLINTAFRDDKTTQVFLSTDHADIAVTDIPTLRAKLNQPGSAVLVATDTATGTLVAHCSVRKLDDHRAWFGMLAVDISHQNRGIGGHALSRAEQYARREWGSSRLEFDVVNTRAELLAWYQLRGYRRTGETRPFPYERHEGWEGVLRDDLCFVILGKDI
ncbi:acetyltransferase [Xylaria sp. CBS 124048]|nr:acetyltransferase [Xylaria sp. CBS 124048]